MVLLRTALLNLKKNIMMSLFVVLEMTAAIVIVTVMISSVLLRYRYYAPFKDMFNSKGLYVEFDYYANSGGTGGQMDTMLNDEDIFEYLHNPTAIAGCNSSFGFIQVEGTGTEEYEFLERNNYCYSDEVIERFTPELSEGRWLNTSNEADTVEIIISENDYGLEVGDTVTLNFYYYPESFICEGKIVGKLKDSAKIFGGFQEHGDDDDFNILYHTYDYEIEEIPAMIMSSEYIAKLDPTVVVGLQYGSLITYPDSVTDEELNEDAKTLSSFGASTICTLEEINENSKEYLYEQVYNLMPVIVVILILTLVSDISSTALSTRRRLHDYAIYYLVGLRWRQCVVINVIQSLIMSIAAAVLSLAAIGIISFTPYASSVKIIWSGWTFLGVLILIGVYLIMSTLMPILIIGRSTPKQILTK